MHFRYRQMTQMSHDRFPMIGQNHLDVNLSHKPSSICHLWTLPANQLELTVDLRPMPLEGQLVSSPYTRVGNTTLTSSMPPWFICDIKGQRLQDELKSEDDRQNPDHHRPSAGECLQADRLYPMVHGPYHTEAQSGDPSYKKQRDDVKIPHEITHENTVHRPPDQPRGKVL